MQISTVGSNGLREPSRCTGATVFAAHLLCFSLLLGPLLTSCNVNAHQNTGGTTFEPTECGRGFVVINTDYQSTNVSLLSPKGDVLSRSFVSSGTTSPALSSALGGDVVAPMQLQSGDSIVLIDRYPASVLTWIDVASAKPTKQLSVATGFAANPRDYAQVGPCKAYVSRYNPNPQPGRMPMDEGADIVTIESCEAKITGRIDLSQAMQGEPDGFYPSPDKILLNGDTAVVLLGSYTADFMRSRESRLAVIDSKTDTLVHAVVLEGLHGCTGIALSPSGTRVAVACSGEFAGTSTPSVDTSGVALLDLTGTQLTVSQRFQASQFGENPIGATIDFATDTLVLFTTSGRFDNKGKPEREDTLWQLNLQSKQARSLLSSENKPFSFGDVRCANACGVCFLADASRDGGVLHLLSLNQNALDNALQNDDAAFDTPTPLVVDRQIGLAPRNLGRF